MRHTTLFGALLACLTVFPAQAQVTPGQVQDTLKPPAPLQTPAAPLAIERQTSPATATIGGATVTVREIRFNGNTVYTQTQLATLVASDLNRPLTLADLYAAADRVTAYYVENGYTLASVSIPPQKLSGGIVSFDVIEGRVSKLSFEGLKTHRYERLEPYLSGLEPGQIYRGDEFETALLRLQEIPGFEARAVVRPGEEFGTSELVIRAREQARSGVVMLDNYGREPVGELRLTGVYTLNNPLRIEDRLQLVGLVSEDGLLAYGSLGYSYALNPRGTRLEFSYSHADFEVDSAIPAEGKSDVLRVEVTHPLRLSRQQTWRVSAGLSTSLSEGETAGLLTSGTDITLLELASLYVRTHNNASVTQVNTQLATNFQRQDRADLLNGQLTPPYSGKQLLRLEVDAQHLQPLGAGFSVLLRTAGVYSPDPLVDTQQFSVGGPNSVRGYPAAEIRGDGGVFGSITLQKPFRLGRALVNTRIYGDSGQVTRDSPLTPGDTSSDSLSSIGLGFDVTYRRYNFKLDWADPTDNHVILPGSEGRISNGRNGRLFAALTAGF